MSDLELLRLLNAAFRAGGRLYHQGADPGAVSRNTRHKGHGRILATLQARGESTQRELADRLDIRPQSLTTALAALEKAGLIRRRGNDADRRELLVTITPEGERRCAELDQIRQSTAETLFSPLSGAERDTLARLLERIVKGASET